MFPWSDFIIDVCNGEYDAGNRSSARGDQPERDGLYIFSLNHHVPSVQPSNMGDSAMLAQSC